MEERNKAAKVSGLCNGLVSHLVEVVKISPENAKTNIDADYILGLIMFRPTQPTTIDADTAAEVRPIRIPGVRIIVRNRQTVDYMAAEAGSSLAEFKKVQWDDLILEANTEHKHGETNW